MEPVYSWRMRLKMFICRVFDHKPGDFKTQGALTFCERCGHSCKKKGY